MLAMKISKWWAELVGSDNSVLHLSCRTELPSRAIAQAVSRLFPTVAAQDKARSNSCRFCCEQNGAGASFFHVLRVPL
jgi:hypothetical protein